MYRSHHRFALFAALALGTAGTLTAQAPRTITYQGVLAEPSGAFVADGSHTLTLRLYDAPTGGNVVWTESQTVITVHGLFNAALGAATPFSPTLLFDRAYWLGVAVDGSTELAPRTALSATPYALYATMAGQAQSLAPGATGVVASLNGGEGALTLVGGGGTSVNRTGSTITISSPTSSGGSGGGLSGIQSGDGIIGVLNPNGPTATLSLNLGAVGSEQLANGAVTLSKLAVGVLPTTLPPSGAAGGDLNGSYPNPTVDGLQGRPVATSAPATGQALKWNGTAWSPAADAGMTLPYADSINTAGATAFRVANTATTGNYTHAIVGQIGAYASVATTPAAILGTASVGHGVYGQSTGGSGAGVIGYGYTGSAGVAATTYQGGNAVDATTAGSGNGVSAQVFGSGTGKAGYFTITNSSNTSTALEATTNGSGGAGRFQLTSASNTSAALSGISASTAGSGSGVYGQIPNTTSTGSNAGAGVWGNAAGTGGANAGVWGNHEGGGPGVFGSSNTGPGVYASSFISSGVGTALEINNGALKVSGTIVPAFVHTSTTANIAATGVAQSTLIDNPVCNNDSNAILIVTPVYGSSLVYNAHPVGVYYLAGSINKWAIYNEDRAAMPTSKSFNILVIKR